MDITTMRIAATVISFITFIGILVWAFSRRNAARFEEAAQLPFMHEDHPPVAHKSEETK